MDVLTDTARGGAKRATEDVSGDLPTSLTTSTNITNNKRPRQGFICDRCTQFCTTHRALLRHQRESCNAGPRTKNFRCPDCASRFGRLETLQRHEAEKHRGVKRIDVRPSADVDGEGGGTDDAKPRNTTNASLPDVSAMVLASTATLPSIEKNEDRSIETGHSPRSSTSDGHDSGIELAALEISTKAVAVYDEHGSSLALPTISEDSDGSATQTDEVLHDETSAPRPYGAPDYHALDSLAVEIDTWIENDLEILAQYVFGQVTNEPGREAEDDAMSISSTRSRDSIRATLSRMRSRRPRAAGEAFSITKTSRASPKTCGLCKKPYEMDETLLRQHLTKHLVQLSTDEDWSVCSVCQIGFARKEDFDLHQRTTTSSDCCRLGRGHAGQCQGYACGFNFKHDRPCNGHHPPGESSSDDSEHDRFKFGQLLRRWELAQMRSMITEVEDLRVSRRTIDRTSKASLPNIKLFQRYSITSMAPSDFSWHSQPLPHDSSVRDVETRLANLSVSGPSANIRRGMTRLRGLQDHVDQELSRAVRQDDLESAVKFIRRGARPNDALRTAIERGNHATIELLLQAGAMVACGHVVNCIDAKDTGLVKLLLSHRNAVMLRKNVGPAFLRMAVGSQQLSMITALLASGVDPNAVPDPLCEYYVDHMVQESGDSIFPIIAHCGLESEGGSPFPRRPLFVAARCGNLEVVSTLLAAGADIEAQEMEGTPLGVFLSSDNIAGIELLLAHDRHVNYESCWQTYGAIELACAQLSIDALGLLLSHCEMTCRSTCEHTNQAFLIGLGEKNFAILDVVARFMPSIWSLRETEQHTVWTLFTDSGTINTYETAPRLLQMLVTELFTTESGQTLLYHAAASGHQQAVQQILDVAKANHADIMTLVRATDLSDELIVRGSAPGANPHAAAAAKKCVTLENLLRPSAHTDPATDILRFVIQQNFAESMTCVLIQFFVEHGVDSNQLSFNETPLRLASRHGLLFVVRLLLEKGANPTCGALHEVVISCMPTTWPIFDALVNAGADVGELYDYLLPRSIAEALGRHWNYIRAMLDSPGYQISLQEHLPGIDLRILRSICQSTSINDRNIHILAHSDDRNPLEWAVRLGSSYLVAVFLLGQPSGESNDLDTSVLITQRARMVKEYDRATIRPDGTAKLKANAAIMTTLRKFVIRKSHGREIDMHIYAAIDTLLGTISRSIPSAEGTALIRQLLLATQTWNPTCSRLIRSLIRTTSNKDHRLSWLYVYDCDRSSSESHEAADDLLEALREEHIPSPSDILTQQQHYSERAVPPRPDEGACT